MKAYFLFPRLKVSILGPRRHFLFGSFKASMSNGFSIPVSQIESIRLEFIVIRLAPGFAASIVNVVWLCLFNVGKHPFGVRLGISTIVRLFSSIHCQCVLALQVFLYQSITLGCALTCPVHLCQRIHCQCVWAFLRSHFESIRFGCVSTLAIQLSQSIGPLKRMKPHQ